MIIDHHNQQLLRLINQLFPIIGTSLQVTHMISIIDITGVTCGCDTFYLFPHPVSSLRIYAFVVSRAFMAGAASQAGDADSSQAPGLTSGLLGSVNVHRGALMFVPQ